MTAIALLWSTRKDIRASDFFHALQEQGAAPLGAVFWDGADRLVAAPPERPVSGEWSLALCVCGTGPDAETAGAIPGLALDGEAGQALALAGRARNARALLGELVCGPASTGGEAECLLGLLSRRGASALQELSGEWGAVHLAAREKRLTLCGDRVGTEALYYHAGPERFAAATAPETALALAGLPRRPDREWLLACLASGARLLPESGDTAYAELLRLRPGCVLQVDGGQGGIRTDLLRFSLLETFVDLPVDAARLCPDVRRAAALREPESGRLGIAWTGGPGAAAVAALAVEHVGKSNCVLYALEQSGRAPAPAAAVSESLGIALASVPWPEHAELEARRFALVRRTGLPLVDPFPALEMDLLCEAMRADALSSAWAGSGARSLLGLGAGFAGEAMHALARRRRVLPALMLRRSLAAGLGSLGRSAADQFGFVLHALAPRPYRSTREQARIELLSHHAPEADAARLLRFYKQCFGWRELSSLRRMQLQRLTRGDGPAGLAGLRLAAGAHGLGLALPLLDQHLARYLRLPLAERLAQGVECPRLLRCLPAQLAHSLRTLPAFQPGSHALVERMAALPPRDDRVLEASPLLRALFPDLPALLADLLGRSRDERFQALPALLDALAEWERACGIRAE
ncbi:hypothetical protein [Paucidesulfovibrio longus]|uniref:hypothetical protein n=1 Tax=Paucidesulfovibrio longus TaxID=889 RepID=UPI0003B43753|nr:hypothetical protein [Paucidesulfovibrio longus]